VLSGLLQDAADEGSACRKRAILTALILLTFFSVPLSSWLGYYKASMTDVLRVLFMPDNSPLSTVVWDLRATRTWQLNMLRLTS
jgi:ABC-type Fe3+-siderophore transport system permease subunit